MRLLLVHPGASWSTHDVYDGLLYGFRLHQQDVITYRLDTRIDWSKRALHGHWRIKKKAEPDLPKPNKADVLYHAGVGALEMALRHNVDAVVVVSAMFLHPDVLIMMKRAGLRVVVLFTETPYDLDEELKIAKMVDGGWTHERTSVAQFRAVNPNFGYCPHAWHPLKHFVRADGSDADVPSHDVVFVGSGFPERVTFFNSIDWTGIDLGLYGSWGKELGLNKQVQACVKGGQTDNARTGALYRRAKMGLNLYRVFKGWGRTAARVVGAESLSPRAYELAACGVFHLSDDRAEVHEVFGANVPTFKTPTEAAALIRFWLHDAEGRARLATNLPACVAESSWDRRAATVLTDLQSLIFPQTAAAVRSA